MRTFFWIWLVLYAMLAFIQISELMENNYPIVIVKTETHNKAIFLLLFAVGMVVWISKLLFLS